LPFAAYETTDSRNRREREDEVELASEQIGSATVVKPTGDLNAATSATLEKALLDHLAAGRNRIVLDLAGVRYVASAGLRVFLILAKRLKADGSFCLARPGTQVSQVLEMSGFASILSIKPDLDEAVASVAA
jgi:stage II sporulation protein AA (anti-sigma F factor antagonist)